MLHSFRKSSKNNLTNVQKNNLKPITTLFSGNLNASISANEAIVKKNNRKVPAEHTINRYNPFPESINLSVFSII